MTEIVLEGRNIVRDYHVGGSFFGKPRPFTPSRV